MSATLTGTPDQITWAEDIRRQTWARLDWLAAQADTSEAMLTNIATARAYLATIESAVRWIDARQPLTEGQLTGGLGRIAGQTALGQWARAQGLRVPKLRNCPAHDALN